MLRTARGCKKVTPDFSAPSPAFEGYTNSLSLEFYILLDMFGKELGHEAAARKGRPVSETFGACKHSRNMRR